MIVSKPKTQTLFSISLFLLISFGASGGILYYWYVSQGPLWLPVIAMVVGSIGLAITLRYFSSYKVLRIGKEKLDVHFPFLLQRKRYSLREVRAWREELVTTGKGTSNYRELQLFFEGRKRYIRLSLQENTEYSKVIGYLQKKAARKRMKA